MRNIWNAHMFNYQSCLRAQTEAAVLVTPVNSERLLALQIKEKTHEEPIKPEGSEKEEKILEKQRAMQYDAYSFQKRFCYCSI